MLTNIGKHIVLLGITFSLQAGLTGQILQALQGNSSSKEAPGTTLEKQLAILQKEKEQCTQRANIETLVKEITHDLALIRQKIKTDVAQAPFYRELQVIKGREYQIATEQKQVRKDIEDIITKHSELLQKYAADVNFDALRAPQKVAYSLEQDLRPEMRNIIDTQARIADLEKEERAAKDEVPKRKKALTTIQDELRSRERQKESFGPDGLKDEYPGLSQLQRSELLDNLIKLLSYKQELAQDRIVEAEVKVSYIQSEVFFLRDQLVVLKEDYARIKRSLVVDVEYVRQAQKKLDEKRQESVALRDKLSDKIRLVLVPHSDALKRKIEETAAAAGIAAGDIASYKDLSTQPKTIAEWRALCEICKLTVQQQLVAIEQEYIETQIELAKIQFRREEVIFDTIRSWQKMTSRHMRGQESFFDQEIKKYDASQTELQAEVSRLKDKRNANIDQLRRLNSFLEKIKAIAHQLKESEAILFKDNQYEFRHCNALLLEAEDLVRKRMDWTAKLIEVYSSAISTATETIQEIEDVIQELTVRNFWRRSTQSIEWGELQHVIPDIQRFVKDVVRQVFTWVSLQRIQSTLSWLSGQMKNPLDAIIMFIWLVLRVVILLLFFLVVRLYLPEFSLYLASGAFENRFFAPIRLFTAALFDFLRLHLISFYLWCILLLAIRFESITNSFIAICFYLLSIPYLLYLAHGFIQYIITINHRQNFLLLSELYERRFVWVVSLFLYCTITLLFFRESFLLGGYHASPVPAVLVAVIFIVLQISLMSLIGRDQLLGVIPTVTPLWMWIKDSLSHYYYIFWLCAMAIILMSNPYVGYGRQVLYILSRILFTLLFIPVLFWLYNRIKRATSGIFFYYANEEQLKERFSSSKIWYVFFLVVILFLLIMFGIVLGANIWGKTLGWYDIVSWLRYELFSPGVDEVGKRITITVMDLATVGMFIVGGVVAYAVVRFTMNQVLGSVSLETGVQNAVVSLMWYVFIIVAFLMGLHHVGLHTMVMTVLVAFGGAAILVKEPIADFFCYLIILIQRPVKIGDFIMLNSANQVRGVVRHITPRSVIVRQNNSVTVILPNTQVVMQPLYNWSYSRTYFAFEDIFVTVPYTCDPAVIRKTIIKVLDINTNILKTPQPIVRLHDFVDNGYQFLIRGFLTADRVLEQWDISSDVRLEIVRILRTSGVEIASPVRTLRVLSKKTVDGTPDSRTSDDDDTDDLLL